jgi:hypothetical protein
MVEESDGTQRMPLFEELVPTHKSLLENEMNQILIDFFDGDNEKVIDFLLDPIAQKPFNGRSPGSLWIDDPVAVHAFITKNFK